MGAQHSAVQHISLLNKWLLLAPAVLPSPEYCLPTLSHPDLHAANIFVDDDRSVSVTAIIDRQGATVRPLFETTIPDFVNINIENLQYVNVPGDLQHPILPQNFDELSTDKKLKACAEVVQVASRHTSGSTGFHHVKPVRPIVCDDDNRP
jgi:hypothetical protein